MCFSFLFSAFPMQVIWSCYVYSAILFTMFYLHLFNSCVPDGGRNISRDISEGLRELPTAVFSVDCRWSWAYHDYAPNRKLEILKPSIFAKNLHWNYTEKLICTFLFSFRTTHCYMIMAILGMFPNLFGCSLAFLVS